MSRCLSKRERERERTRETQRDIEKLGTRIPMYCNVPTRPAIINLPNIVPFNMPEGFIMRVAGGFVDLRGET